MQLQNIASHFGLTSVVASELFGHGLINSSYRVTTDDGKAYFLQQVNTSVFTNPQVIQENYRLLEKHLSSQGALQLPRLIPATSGELLYHADGKSWRCFEFLTGTYSPTVLNTPGQAYETARCFGSFTAALHTLDNNQVQTVVPHFHDLSYRFGEFAKAQQQAPEHAIASVKYLIETIEEYRWLNDWFEMVNADKNAFPLHILHHDCKVSNILFDKATHAIRCPVDLDTTQPGLFFSDIGDMMRTMVPDKDENETDIQSIRLRPEFFQAVITGYLDAMANHLTREEKENLPKAGMVLAYMQAMRFLTDYLNGNVYYRTEYKEQNKDRTANQLRLLHLFQEYAKNEL